MFKQMNIKNIVFLFIAFLLIIMLILQILLYVFLKTDSNKTSNMILNSIAESTTTQIDMLLNDVCEFTSLMSTEPLIQNNLYSSSHSKIVANINELRTLANNYRQKIQNDSCLIVFKSNNPFIISDVNDIYHEIYPELKKQLPKAVNKSSFFPSFVSNGHTYFTYVTPIVPIGTNYSSPKDSGNYILYIFEMNNINFAPYSFIDNKTLRLALTDANNNILLSENFEEHGKELFPSKKESPALYRKLPLKLTNWNAHIFVPSGQINTYDVSRLIIVFMAILDIIILSLLLTLLKNIIIKRITHLKSGIENVPMQNTDYQIEYGFSDEFSDVVHVINNMLLKIHALTKEKVDNLEKMYKAQLIQKETQIYYLHNQISPHFLYNSMSYIQSVAVKYDAKEIIYMTASFSKLFRYFSNNMTFSTIRQDIDCAIEYFNIINNRRTRPITLLLNVDPDIGSVKCLKMIYQPILENVLKYAFSSSEGGTLSITSVSDKAKAIIEISDDGHGMDEITLSSVIGQFENENLSPSDFSSHTGLLNVHSRLRLYYGEGNGLEITSQEGRGTSVRIIFDRTLPVCNDFLTDI